MTDPTDRFMESRIPYLVRKCEDSSSPVERMCLLAEIESEIEAYAAKRRADAIAECVKFVEEDAWILRNGESSADDAGDVEARRTLKAKAEAVEELAQLLENGVKP